MKRVVFLALAFVLLASACATSLATVGVAFRVESNVPDATIWIDDVLVGRVADWQRQGRYIRPGFHRVEIRHPDYYSYFAEIEPAAGTQTSLRAQLHPLLQ
ncbi:MAG TPA: PEGA domain-containing protein [Polyangia bacterium]|nr:PEGA domain-containing protein [Polyangia bacterium]